MGFGHAAKGSWCWIEARRSPFSVPELPAPSLACDVTAPGQFGIHPNRFRGGGCPFWIPPESVLTLPLLVASLAVAL
ncbi:hypothetical protein PIB30_087137 [Stylosanthes scabra]|uniref:Uncharacterized protein n=1 Tax=Stylosanthes scabra TaxID=79078 RepID=A0ABU6QUG7_9FABA|nr:hypothetical protein [Stylosanthes scabra]